MIKMSRSIPPQIWERYNDGMSHTISLQGYWTHIDGESMGIILAEMKKEKLAAECKHEDAVYWNPHNNVVQCHRCGQVFVPEESSE